MPENDTAWVGKLISLIKYNVPILNARNDYAYNSRLGCLGREEEATAYRSAIFYLQLSPELDPGAIDLVLQAVHRYMKKNVSLYHILYMNNEQGDLLYEKKPCQDWKEAGRLCRERLDELGESNHQYSGTLNKLFPLVDIYSHAQYPDKKDLCLIIHDDGFSLPDEVRESMAGKCSKLISITARAGVPVTVEQLKK